MSHILLTTYTKYPPRPYYFPSPYKYQGGGAGPARFLCFSHLLFKLTSVLRPLLYGNTIALNVTK